MPNGILAVAFDFTTAHADEFHDWYDLEHIPERQRVPGFGRCERFIGVDHPTEALAIYDLDNLDVLRSEAYKAVAYDNLSPWSKRVTSMCKRLVRFEGTMSTAGARAAPAGAGGFLLNAMNCAPEGEDDFNKWYDEEHLPALAAVPGTMLARRYVAPTDAVTTHKYLAIYHLEDPEVTRTDAWKKAVETPWTARVRPYMRDRVRIL
ncbi:MAG TPA: hypothetical protein VKA18_05380, partial [Alphaproteobacteria bacterium]|nr:hypothetical protein [Alphaproteobacteria bacterium]